jgi:predicted RND superfamily exporter protein
MKTVILKFDEQDVASDNIFTTISKTHSEIEQKKENANKINKTILNQFEDILRETISKIYSKITEAEIEGCDFDWIDNNRHRIPFAEFTQGKNHVKVSFEMYKTIKAEGVGEFEQCQKIDVSIVSRKINEGLYETLTPEFYFNIFSDGCLGNLGNNGCDLASELEQSICDRIRAFIYYRA